MSEQTSETGAMTLDQAIESLTPQEQPAEAEAPEEATAEAEQEPQGEASSPEETAEEAENPEAGEETEAEDAEPVVALEPPKYWSQEAKARFADLPPELQEVVLAQEGPREEAAAKAKQEAAEVRQKAEQELQGVGKLAELLSAEIPKWQQAFQSKWGSDPDWVAHAQQVGVEQATLDKLAYDQDLKQLQDAQNAQRIAEQKAFATYVQTEFAKLAEIEPELAPDPKDPAKGADRRAEVVKYLTGQGISNEQINAISAAEMSIARKAMLWDQAKANLKAPKPKPAAPPAKSAARPAAVPAQSPQQRSAKQIANRFAQTRSIDDAVALLLSQG